MKYEVIKKEKWDIILSLLGMGEPITLIPYNLTGYIPSQYDILLFIDGKPSFIIQFQSNPEPLLYLLVKHKYLRRW